MLISRIITTVFLGLSFFGFCDAQGVNHDSKIIPITVTGNGCIDLLNEKSVREELRLDDLQSQELDSKIKLFGDTNAELILMLQSGITDMKKFSDQSTKCREMLEEFEENIPDMLDPTQVKQLADLCVAREGFFALSYCVVAERLELTFAQRQKIRRIRLKSSSPFDAGSKIGTAKGVLEKMKLQKSTLGSEFLVVLTEPQKAVLESLKR